MFVGFMILRFYRFVAGIFGHFTLFFIVDTVIALHIVGWKRTTVTI